MEKEVVCPWCEEKSVPKVVILKKENGDVREGVPNAIRYWRLIWLGKVVSWGMSGNLKIRIDR